MSTIQTETLYKKVGRRYIPVNEGIDRHDLKVPVGGSVLIVSTGPGCHTYQYNVDPDRAAFLAAATLFRDAMVSHSGNSWAVPCARWIGERIKAIRP